MAYDNVPTAVTLNPTKFVASVPQQDIDDFKQLLKLSKLGPKTYENTKNDDPYFGVSYEWLSNAKKQWETDFDWRKTEAHINSFPNYKVDVQGDDGTNHDIHFVALFSEKKDAIPLLLMHGWPGSFLEFLPIMSLLKSKYSPADLPYHIINPSLPGYGYSAESTPIDKNWTTMDTAGVMNKLMVGLGFGSGYAAQGGDVGSFVARMLASKFDECKAAHLNFCVMGKPESVSDSDITAAEGKGLATRYKEFMTTGNAYVKEHATRPATIGHVLSSSPLALLAWISEKFLTWPDPSSNLPVSDILSSVTLYWLTECYPRCIWPYRDLQEPIHDGEGYRIPETKAFGFSWFPFELAPVPRAWVATTGRLDWFKAHESGGHFAAMEKPKELLEDIEEFLGKCWGRGGAKL